METSWIFALQGALSSFDLKDKSRVAPEKEFMFLGGKGSLKQEEKSLPKPLSKCGGIHAMGS